MFVIVPGTSQKITMTLPNETGELTAVYITVKQKNGVTIEHDISKCEITGNVVSTILTQEETLQLKPKTITRVQLRGITKNGDPIATEIYDAYTYETLKAGAI